MTWQAKALGIDLDALKREARQLDDDWIGTARAANRFHVSQQTIYRYVTAGKIRFFKDRGRLWVSAGDLAGLFDTPGR